MLGDSDPGLVALAVAAIGGVYLGQAARWRAIARTPSVSTGRFGEMVVSGVAVNNVLPGRIGDLLRARWLQVAARIPVPADVVGRVLPGLRPVYLPAAEGRADTELLYSSLLGTVPASVGGELPADGFYAGSAG